LPAGLRLVLVRGVAVIAVACCTVDAEEAPGAAPGNGEALALRHRDRSSHLVCAHFGHERRHWSERDFQDSDSHLNRRKHPD